MDIAAALLTIIQASFTFWARENWIEKEQTLPRKRVITKISFTLALLITLIEAAHVIAALCRVPLYTTMEL